MQLISGLSINVNLVKVLRILVIILVLSMIRVKGASTLEGATKRPNIVLILADDMGYSDIGCYGGEIHTPNLDKLASDGMRFTQFYVNAKSNPTRAELLTGLYHQQSDYLRNTGNHVTLAEVLKSGGYSTIMSGKWHLGDWRDEEDLPVDRGFNHYFGCLGGAINFFNGEDFGTGRNLMYLGRKTYDVPQKFYATDAFTDYAIRFLKDREKKNKPFFLYLAYNAPHFPLQVPQREIEKYREKYSKGWEELRKRRFKRMIQMGLLDPQWKLSQKDSIVPSWESLNQENKEEEQLLMATYAGMIDRMDQQIGRLINYLDQQGMIDNTLIMFLSDNGACPYDRNRTPDLPPGPSNSSRTYDTEWANVSNTPFRLYKKWIHEGGISTPMIVYWPEVIESGSITRQPAHVIDIMPTLVDVAQASYPASYHGDSILPMEGNSLLPLLKGKEVTDRDPLFWEYRGSRGVRKNQWKLVAERGKSWELYNIREDRTETNNLINKHPYLVEELEELYNQWAKRIGARTNKEAHKLSPNQQDRYLYEDETGLRPNH